MTEINVFELNLSVEETQKAILDYLQNTHKVSFNQQPEFRYLMHGDGNVEIAVRVKTVIDKGGR